MTTKRWKRSVNVYDAHKSVFPLKDTIQGPVVRKAVSANPGLKIKLGFDFSCIKAYIMYNVLWGFILVSGKTEGNKIYTANLSAKL